MPNSSHLFTDRVFNIAVTGSLVRIEMGAILVPTTKEQKPQLVPTQTLVIPLDGFRCVLRHDGVGDEAVGEGWGDEAAAERNATCRPEVRVSTLVAGKNYG